MDASHFEKHTCHPNKKLKMEYFPYPNVFILPKTNQVTNCKGNLVREIPSTPNA